MMNSQNSFTQENNIWVSQMSTLYTLYNGYYKGENEYEIESVLSITEALKLTLLIRKFPSNDVSEVIDILNNEKLMCLEKLNFNHDETITFIDFYAGLGLKVLYFKSLFSNSRIIALEELNEKRVQLTKNILINDQYENVKIMSLSTKDIEDLTMLFLKTEYVESEIVIHLDSSQIKFLSFGNVPFQMYNHAICAIVTNNDQQILLNDVENSCFASSSYSLIYEKGFIIARSVNH